jgi:tRNA(Ile)-lysidine synthase
MGVDPLLRQLQRTIHEYRMLEGTRTLLVAVSGGPDSVAMLHALHQLRAIFPVTLVVAHLDHRLRLDAAADARFVEGMAADLGVPCVSASVDVPAYQRRHKLSPEDAGRRVRYAFLERTAAEQGAERIAVGHTADDQAETVLMRLFRGTGLQGLRGISPVRGAIIRPLIRLHRQDILAFLKAQGIPFREDPTNQQRHYRRNRIRLDLLPLLQQGFNPRIVEALCRTAELLADDEAALRAAAQQALEAARIHGLPGEVRLRIDVVTPFPLALQRRVLRAALEEAAGHGRDFTHRHIAAMLGLLQRRDGRKWLALPGGMVVERVYDVLHLRRGLPPAPHAVDQVLPIPGRCCLLPLGLTLVSHLQSREAFTGPFPKGDQACFDAAQVGGEVRVRTRRSGDRFQPLGSSYPKKLKTFLIDAKIPQPMRDRLPLLVSSAGIAWVAGVRMAEWARVTPSTREILCVQLHRHPTGEAPSGGS